MKRRKRKLSPAYARRTSRGLKRGLTRSQARGHPTAKERFASKKTLTLVDRQKIRNAISAMAHDKTSLNATARSIGLSPERLRRVLNENKLVKKRGRRWVLVNTRAPIRMFSEGREIEIAVPNRKSRSEIGRYMNAVRAFLRSNEPEKLDDFVGKSVTDAARRSHAYETDPEALYQLASTGSESFEDIYRYII
jgi:hypothetical protein